MEQAFDKSSVINTLKNGVVKGYWTVEDLDIPTSGWIDSSNTNVVMQSGAKSALRFFPVRMHKNLLRDIDPKELEELIEIGNNYKKEKEGNSDA